MLSTRSATGTLAGSSEYTTANEPPLASTEKVCMTIESAPASTFDSAIVGLAGIETVNRPSLKVKVSANAESPPSVSTAVVTRRDRQEPHDLELHIDAEEKVIPLGSIMDRITTPIRLPPTRAGL